MKSLAPTMQSHVAANVYFVFASMCVFSVFGVSCKPGVVQGLPVDSSRIERIPALDTSTRGDVLNECRALL